jgi:hypothetical protein
LNALNEIETEFVLMLYDVPLPSLTCAQFDSAPICTGEDLNTTVLSPSCPAELLPQAHNVPSDLIASVVSPPKEILYQSVIPI